MPAILYTERRRGHDGAMGIALRIFLLILTFTLAALTPARGNVTNDGRYTISYDLADQPVSISGSGVSK